MENYTVKAPWFDIYHQCGIPEHLNYFRGTLFEAVEAAGKAYPDSIALTFMGRQITYRKMTDMIRRCARSLSALGIREGDAVTIALPNCPQAIYLFYAINAAGAVANMVHPLSAEKELEFYITESDSVAAVTLDQFYEKMNRVKEKTGLKHLIITGIQDELSLLMSLGYALTEGRKIKKIPSGAPVILWKAFLSSGSKADDFEPVPRKADDPAVILYSGGTTGISKGICLTNLNFNALALQLVTFAPNFRPGDRVLSAMPTFHGFGLGVSIHTFLYFGGQCILVPRFTPDSYSRMITKHQCNFIAGVPTLFEAMLRTEVLKNANLSCLKGVFCGGDSLTPELKKKLDRFLEAHHATVQVREGYGTTETVTACCLSPEHIYKTGSIGIPFPDVYMKVVKPDTDIEVPYGEEGEILLAGPTVMKEYIHHPEETAKTLRTHADGLSWIYTGDLGYMDEEGFVYFKGRLKRMIITSGYNVYPAQLENIIEHHPKVQMSCVIGVPDAYKMQRVKAFIVLKPGVPKSIEVKAEIMAFCRKNIAKYALPKEIEFRDELPKTLVGKVAYRLLEEEESQKNV